MNVRGAALAGLAIFFAGCGSMEIDTRLPNPNPNRVVTGTVELGDLGDVPPGAEVSVRVLDTIQPDFRSPTAVLGEPSTQTPGVQLPPQVVGEEDIKNASGSSIPFAVHYTANEDQLRAGLVLDARVSIDGKVRYYNASSYSLNLANAADPHHIYVNSAR